MNWKELFKPTMMKIIICLVLLVGLNYWFLSGSDVSDGVILKGVPFGFYPVGAWNWNFYMYSGTSPPDVNISYLYLFLNLVFWYFFACIFTTWFKSPNKWSFNSFFSVFLLLLIPSSFLLVVFWLKYPRFNFKGIMFLILSLGMIAFSVLQLNKKGFKDSYEIE